MPIWVQVIFVVARRKVTSVNIKVIVEKLISSSQGLEIAR